jgi:hypothetical protein
MRIARWKSAGRNILVAALVCLSAMLSSCSTVGTFLSNLDLPSFSGEQDGHDRKIPLPPMAEDYAHESGDAGTGADQHR